MTGVQTCALPILKVLIQNKSIFKSCVNGSKKMFLKKYDPDEQIKNIMKIFDDVLNNPYPHKVRRIFFAVINKIYVVLKKTAALMQE